MLKFLTSRKTRDSLALDAARIRYEKNVIKDLEKSAEIEANVRKIALDPMGVILASEDDQHSYGIAVFLIYVCFKNDPSEAPKFIGVSNRAIPEPFVTSVVHSLQENHIAYDALGTNMQTLYAWKFVKGMLMAHGVGAPTSK